MTENSAQNQRWSWATCGAVLLGLILYMSSGRNVAQKGPIPAANSTIKSNSVAPNEVGVGKANEALRTFCTRVVAADKKFDLRESSDFQALGSKCKNLAFALNSISTNGIDGELAEWLGRYTNLLLEMSECCGILATRNAPEYQMVRVLEFIRSAQGDPLGVPIAEMNLDQIGKQILISFENRRLKLLFEFQRRVNAIAPPGIGVDVSR